MSNNSQALKERFNENNVNKLQNKDAAEIDDIAGSIFHGNDAGLTAMPDSNKDGAIPDKSKLFGQDIKFRELKLKKEEIAKKRKIQDEARKLAEEEYAAQKREQTYKRLMHLLSKSQFYSSYIVDKLNDNGANKITGKKKIGKGKAKEKAIKKETTVDENTQPRKKSLRVSKQNSKYNISEYVTVDMKLKLAEQKKMNLSQEEIEAELSGNFDAEDIEAEETSAFVVPKYFQGDLREYQKVGLQWLKVLYENGVNGILADEMGLGKTIQVIALFCHLLEKQQDGPYLIIAPLSTIPNWLIEFENFAPNLPVVTYHGTREVREAAERKIRIKQPIGNGYKTYPIVLTTYEVPIRDSKYFRSVKWRYIVIDEGHRIKNHKCQLVGVLRQCKSMNRLLLTGTPLQNNLTELWSLLNFLLPEIFNDLAVFESWFTPTELQQNDAAQKVLKQEEEKQIVTTLREILKPFMLRRIKTDVCLDIPPKKEIVVYAPLTELQHNLYLAVLRRNLEVLSKIENEESILLNAETRPKRKCLMRHKHSSIYVDLEDDSSQSPSLLDAETYHAPIGISKNAEEKNLDEWRQYTDVTDRNKDYLVRIRFGNRGMLYRQIVNHPFLLHCPLDSSGLPEISENLVKASGKLLVLDSMLAKLKPQGHKILLFSTFTMMLDLIAEYLSMRGYQYVMLDGRVDIEERQQSIKLFNSDPDVFIFLISTRAGGVGLNLAGADTVIIYDSDWNPQVDIQAMARCHRIGQTRPVVIYRLCTKGTIDEAIIHRAEAKRRLEKMVICKHEIFSLTNKETLLELKRLLDSTERKIVTASKDVYTEAELDRILDRSDLLDWKKPVSDDTEEDEDKEP